MHMRLFGQRKQVGTQYGECCISVPTETNSQPGIPWEYFNLISDGFLKKGETDEQKVVEGRQKYDAALAEKILSAEVKPELIVLAGWMHVFSTAFLDPVKKAGINIINLHPSVPLRCTASGLARMLTRLFQCPSWRV